MTNSADYPASLDEVIRDVTYRNETLVALRRFKRAAPWQGDLVARMIKFRKLHDELCFIYGIDYELCFDPSVVNNESSSQSNCNFVTRTITLHGKLSVLTFLHEWGHVLKGRSERLACIWSVNLFRKIFPDNFDRLRNNARGHFLTS